MKKIHFFIILILAITVVINAACKKESPATGSGSGIINPPPPPPNYPPKAEAGEDFTGVWYSNYKILKGAAYDANRGDTLTTKWTKIAGPACTIDSPQILKTTVTNLIAGDYQFELLVRDNFGATDRDTVALRISSIEQITSPVNIFNLSWLCPMGCTITIYDIYNFIPPNRPIRVFIKFINTTVWSEAVPMSQYPTNNWAYYYYGVDNANNIFLYTDFNMNTNVDVRIEF